MGSVSDIISEQIRTCGKPRVESRIRCTSVQWDRVWMMFSKRGCLTQWYSRRVGQCSWCSDGTETGWLIGPRGTEKYFVLPTDDVLSTLSKRVWHNEKQKGEEGSYSLKCHRLAAKQGAPGRWTLYWIGCTGKQRLIWFLVCEAAEEPRSIAMICCQTGVIGLAGRLNPSSRLEGWTHKYLERWTHRHSGRGR
jgi:hypothetical protein